MQIKNGEYDQASNDEVCSDDNNKADPRQHIYEQKTKQGLIGESNLSLQLGRSVYPHNRQTSLFYGLFVNEKDHPHCQTQKIPIGNRSTFSNNTCSTSGPRSRSTSLPRSHPLSPTPSLSHFLSLEINQTKNKDLHRSSVKKKIIVKTSDPSLNHPSPTNTIKYMKDNNIAKNIDTV